MRLLMIGQDPGYLALVRHHASCRWPDAAVSAYDLGSQGSLQPEFLAQGYDAVVLDEDACGDAPLEVLHALVSRPGFAPVIFLASGREGVAAQAAALGACAVLTKPRIRHGELIGALEAAAARQAEARAIWRTSREGLHGQTFGDTRLPGYRRIRKLAAGPVSDLFLAEGEAAGELVVLKITRDRGDQNELDESFRRFLQEHEIAQRIDHPSVVRHYDLGISDEHAYLVMEYFPAGDLRRRMRAGVTADEALRLCDAIAAGLEAIHAAGVLHRDLKPGNIMLRAHGGIGLIDFGLAKHEALRDDITDRGMIFGTPHYMSPEQGHGEPIDERSDLYSLGVILYEMLTGQKPFVADNPMAVIYKHRKAPVPELPEDLQELQPLLARFLTKDPAGRFGSAAEAREALEAVRRPRAAAAAS